MERKLKHIFLILLLLITQLLFIANPVLAVDFLLTDWTEVDAGSDLSVSMSSIQYDVERSDVCMVYNDFGVDFWSGNFQFNFEWEVTTSVQNSDLGMMLISNTIGTERQAIVAPTFASLSIYMNNPSSPDEVRIWLYEIDSSLNSYNSASYLVMGEGTKYYFTLVRDETIGAFGRLTLYRYSDVSRLINAGSIYIDLHEEQNFQYVHALTAYGGTGSYTTTGEIGDISGASFGGDVPDVLTYPQSWHSSYEAYLLAFVSSASNVTDTGFDIGLSSGNYTWSISSDDYDDTLNRFYAISDNFTIGETYYFRGKAENTYGWGYGNEVSFIWTPNIVDIFLSEATVTQCVSGNFTVTFFVEQNPILSSNVTATLSTLYPPNEDIALYLISADGNRFIFSTWNGTSGNSGCVLLEGTTYYYRGYVTYGSTTHNSVIKSFTTANATYPDKPSVVISSLNDLSRSYNQDYVFEVTAKINTTNTTDLVNYEGIELSLNQAPDGTLLAPVYEYIASYYGVDVAPDGTYTMVFLLDNASWYNGEQLYIKAFIRTSWYGKIYSSTAIFTPITTSQGDTVIDDFSEVVKDARIGLGLTGVMGTWAFMGLILLIVALLFGTTMFAQKDNDTVKTIIGVVWCLISIAVVGAFVFTGELGIWPILILVGGVVALIIIVASVKLSGGQA